jgi:hypothetical protein
MRSALKSFIPLAFAMLALAAQAPAQADFAIGSIIKDFALPQRDAEGQMKLQIFGDQATIISANRIKVEKLRIEVFQGGKPDIQIASPESDFWKIENRLTTAHGVTITHPAITLQAQRMDWELNENRGLFQGGVTVQLQKSEALAATPALPIP